MPHPCHLNIFCSLRQGLKKLFYRNVCQTYGLARNLPSFFSPIGTGHSATYFQECDNNLNFYSNEFCSWFLRILYCRFLVNFDLLILFLISFCSRNSWFAQKIEFKSLNFGKKIYSDNFPNFFRLKSYWLLIKKKFKKLLMGIES